MALSSESTSFTLDNMGRFLCNTLQEARESAAQSVGGRTRDFDVIIIGGGTFGSVIAEHLFITDKTRSRRILVLEAGPFVLDREVVQIIEGDFTRVEGTEEQRNGEDGEEKILQNTTLP